MSERDENTLRDANIGHRAMGLASEAMGAARSLEALTNLQIENMQREIHEIKMLLGEGAKSVDKKIDDLCQKLDDRFKILDNRFWGLAMVTITLLVTALISLLVKLLFPHIGG